MGELGGARATRKADHILRVFRSRTKEYRRENRYQLLDGIDQRVLTSKDRLA